LLISWKLSFLVVGLKNLLPPFLYWNLPTKFHVVLWEFIKYMVQLLIKVIFYNITFILTWCAHILHPWPHSIIHNILSLMNSTLLTANLIP
jgi:hypothetical protein